jgi:hypothetical protein
MIIAIGITSLVGILTATDSLKALLNENFGKWGLTHLQSAQISLIHKLQTEEQELLTDEILHSSQARDFISNYNIPSVTDNICNSNRQCNNKIRLCKNKSYNKSCCNR